MTTWRRELQGDPPHPTSTVMSRPPINSKSPHSSNYRNKKTSDHAQLLEGRGMWGWSHLRVTSGSTITGLRSGLRNRRGGGGGRVTKFPQREE